MDVTGDDELGELAKNGEVINLMANCGETSVLQVELTLYLRYLFCHSCHPWYYKNYIIHSWDCEIAKAMQEFPDVLLHMLRDYTTVLSLMGTVYKMVIQ